MNMSNSYASTGKALMFPSADQSSTNVYSELITEVNFAEKVRAVMAQVELEKSIGDQSKEHLNELLATKKI